MRFGDGVAAVVDVRGGAEQHRCAAIVVADVTANVVVVGGCDCAGSVQRND